MPPDGPSRFKTRFSNISMPGFKQKQPDITPYPMYLPPPVSLAAVHSVAQNVHCIGSHRASLKSQHASPGMFVPSSPLPPLPTGLGGKLGYHLSPPESPYPIDIEAYAQGGAASSEASPESSPKPRPPPLDLERTHQVYPAKVVREVPPPPLLNVARGRIPPAPTVARGSDTTATLEFFDVEKHAGDYKASETLEAEGGRYPTWKNTRHLEPAATVTAPHQQFAASHARDLGNSVLHDVFLTPTYNTFSSSPGPSGSNSTVKGPQGAIPAMAANAARLSTAWIMRPSALKRDGNGDGDYNDRPRPQRTVRMALPLPLPEKDAYAGYPKARSVASTASPASSVHRAPRWSGAREWVMSDVEKVKAAVGGRQAGYSNNVEQKKNKRNRCIVLVVLVVFILIVVLCIKLIHKSPSTSIASDASSASNSGTPTATATSSSAPSAATTSSAMLATCLSSFTNDAPSNPQAYACGDCVPVLESAVNDYTLPLDGGNSTGVGAALQFCALMDLYGQAAGQDFFSSGGWGANASPCESTVWSGLNCDERGRVTGLAITAAAVPATLPAKLTNLVSLATVSITGNNSFPTGTLPPGFFSLANLTSVMLQGTALTGPIDTLDVAAATELTSLWLVGNKALGSTLPDLSGNKKLNQIVMTHAGLTAAVDTAKLPSSLTYIDLSYNSIEGQVPNMGSFPNLSTMTLSNNAFTLPPTTLPTSLRSLNLATNPKLNGTVPAAMCSLASLTSCDLRNTGLKFPSAANACGDCLLSASTSTT